MGLVEIMGLRTTVLIWLMFRHETSHLNAYLSKRSLIFSLQNSNLGLSSLWPILKHEVALPLLLFLSTVEICYFPSGICSFLAIKATLNRRQDIVSVCFRSANIINTCVKSIVGCPIFKIVVVLIYAYIQKTPQENNIAKTARGLLPPHIVLGSDSTLTQTFLLRQLDYFLLQEKNLRKWEPYNSRHKVVALVPLCAFAEGPININQG